MSKNIFCLLILNLKVEKTFYFLILLLIFVFITLRPDYIVQTISGLGQSQNQGSFVTKNGDQFFC